MSGSWRTTATAVLAAIAAVATAVSSIVNDGASSVDWNGLQVSIVAAITSLGLWQARDNSVTSEEAGAVISKRRPVGPPMILAGIMVALSSSAYAQPKAPSIAIGPIDDQRVVEIEWTNPVRVLEDYVRVNADLGGGVIAQGYASKTVLLVDVFNVGEEPIRIGFVGVGDPTDVSGEYDRTVPPGAGIAWSSSPPTTSPEDPGPGAYDELFDPVPWAKVDVGWTFTTGSPRNKFESRQLWIATETEPGVSRAMEAWLDRWTRWQLMRAYQDPDPATALPNVLLGKKIGPNVWHKYPGIGTVTTMDTHHQTLGVLRDAYVLTRNPRALDQIAREYFWAYAGQDYYDPTWHWPYGGTERVPGWLLTSQADAVQAFRVAGYDSLIEEIAMDATDHVNLLLELGFNELGLPNIVNTPDPGRHLGVPFNMPWHGATLAWGLLRIDEELGVPNSDELAELWLDYLEEWGWNGDPVNPIAFDSVPHYPEDQDVLPKPAGMPGVGMWAAPALIWKRPDSAYLTFIVDVAEDSKYNGNPLISPSGFPSLFARIIDWNNP